MMIFDVLLVLQCRCGLFYSSLHAAGAIGESISYHLKIHANNLTNFTELHYSHFGHLTLHYSYLSNSTAKLHRTKFVTYPRSGEMCSLFLKF